jgi:predicted transcriptional regulator
VFNKNKFKAILVEKGISVYDVAKLLGISPATLYRKMNGESDFFREEIQKIGEVIGKDIADEIFFAPKVT